MEKYELIAVISEKISDDELPKVSKKIQKTIQAKSGKIKSEETLGKKKLAYQMQKDQFGTFLVFQLSCEKNDLKSLTLGLNKTPEILRFMISKLKEKPIKEAKKAAKKSVPKKAKAEPEKPAAQKAKVEVKESAEKPALKKAKPAAKKVIKKEKKPAKPKITKEIESEAKRLEKLDEELGKILDTE